MEAAGFRGRAGDSGEVDYFYKLLAATELTVTVYSFAAVVHL